MLHSKHSSLLGPFTSYEENEVFWIRIKWPYSQHFIFFETNELAYLDKVLHFKHSGLLDSFTIYEENEVLWIQP